MAGICVEGCMDRRTHVAVHGFCVIGSYAVEPCIVLAREAHSSIFHRQELFLSAY
jgi:hypothetical protein